MRAHRPLGTALVGAAATLVLAGCSSSGGGGAAAAEETTSPLGVYLDAVYGGDLSPEEQQRQSDDDNRRIEELVADCMQEQGFEYVPNTQTGTWTSSSDTEWDPEDREWVSQWGYGAVNWPGRDDVPEDTGEEYVDPNGDYVSSLSESEQAAFYEALSGPQPTEEEMAAMEDGSFEYDWQNSGCYGVAQHEVYEADDLSQSEEFAPLFEAMDEFWTSSADSPEMSALDGEWAACMDAAGHPGFSQQYDAQNSIYDAQNELYEAGGSGEEYVEPDQDEMDALGEREVELALADLDCRDETDYRDRQTTIQNELEQQFVDDHRTELEALRAAAEQD